ncbi:MAG: T9SS type A sorting domain-containing protein [Candidatus Handelsmanbacteria bacterium]|nr:T9SS type A sorting domain-containing protein [Candidatus Handelsmanbacteria bacterium]
MLLGNALNADLGDAQGLGTIRSDDPLPGLSLAADLATAKGNIGNTTLAFVVNLSAASNQTVTVAYATIDNSAQAGSDYVAASGTLTFAPGQTSKTINVIVRGDLAFEGDEFFALNLRNPLNAALGDGLALGTLRNDDPTPAIAVNDTAIAEGHSGNRQLVVRVRLSNPTSLPVSVAYTTAASSARAGSDYTAISGRLQFNPLETLKSLSVLVRGDAVHEGEETLLLLLSDPLTAGLGRARAATLLRNDDAPAYLSAADTALAAGDQGIGRLAFLVALSAPLAEPATADGSAKANSDYTPASGTLTFEPGQIRKTVEVAVLGDNLYEPDETFDLLLSNPLNADLGRARAPADTLALGAYPNPANPTTTLAYTLGADAPFRLMIFDLLGPLVHLLVNEAHRAGAYRVEWNRRDEKGWSVGPGVYLYRLEAGNQVLKGKHLLVR